MNDWNHYNHINARDTKMSKFWMQTTVNYLRNNVDLSNSNVLDYGCGYFDLGFAITDKVAKVDGYDPFEPGIDYAKKTASILHHTNKHIITAKITDIPKNHYDLILLNSVTQYFNDYEELANNLQFFKQLLKHENSSCSGKILLVDVVSPQTNFAMDALQNLWVATQNKLLFPMLIHLFKATMNRNDKKLLRIDPEKLQHLAIKTGFKECTFIKNLSPSKQRYSCILSS